MPKSFAAMLVATRLNAVCVNGLVATQPLGRLAVEVLPSVAGSVVRLMVRPLWLPLRPVNA